MELSKPRTREELHRELRDVLASTRSATAPAAAAAGGLRVGSSGASGAAAAAGVGAGAAAPPHANGGGAATAAEALGSYASGADTTKAPLSAAALSNSGVGAPASGDGCDNNGGGAAAIAAAMPDLPSMRKAPQQQQQPLVDSSTASASAAGRRAWVANAVRAAGDGGPGGGASSQCWSRDRWCFNAKGALAVLRRHPSTWTTGLLVALALAAAGCASVAIAARNEATRRTEIARGFVDNAAVAFEVQIQQLLAPLLALAAMIHANPAYAPLAARFDRIAAELLAALPDRDAVASLQATPQGVVRSFYPLKGNEQAMGHNLLKDPARRDAALETIARGELTIQGPVMLKQGFMGLVPRLPIFLEGVAPGDVDAALKSIGAPDTPYDCPPGLCYNATTGRLFWGFVSCVINFQGVVDGSDSRLRSLLAQGYRYALLAPQPDRPPDAPPLVFSSSSPRPLPPPASVESIVHVPDTEAQWNLWLAPARGWVPGWRDPMLAVAALAAALVGGLVAAVLVSRRQQAWLLREAGAANVALNAEKERMDVLLARQHNLISCVLELGAIDGGDGRDGKGNGRFSSGAGSANGSRSLQEETLARIEDMRRAIGVAPSLAADGSGGVGADDVSLDELIGEGSFGKVYKGLWRGSVVAVKTMVLPARMSGAEKRERMAIMETAISSSLSHPCIVQTYTYAIRPVFGAQRPPPERQPSSSTLGSAGPAAGGGAGDAPPPGQESPLSLPAATAQHVHSFEVSLVLEYCDFGCLRSALDAGAFYTAANSLNYAAILDTASDVAKAMAHLHRHNVVHADLKARNVLLKSDGSNGRGAVAKVADFGLAVRIDAGGTHVSAIQGTLSHMAPEAQLGRVSKAGDVYSFGIVMWELYTGGHAYGDIPRALLGHKVAVQGLRPRFPPFAPRAYRELAEACWAGAPEKRPTFDAVVAALADLRKRLGGPTPPITRCAPPPAQALAPPALDRPGAQQRSVTLAASSGDSSGFGGGGGALPLSNHSGGGLAPAVGGSTAAIAAGVLQLGSMDATAAALAALDGGGPGAAGAAGGGGGALVDAHGYEDDADAAGSAIVLPQPGGGSSGGGGGGAGRGAARRGPPASTALGGGSFSHLEPIADADNEGDDASHHGANNSNRAPAPHARAAPLDGERGGNAV